MFSARDLWSSRPWISSVMLLVYSTLSLTNYNFMYQCIEMVSSFTFSIFTWLCSCLLPKVLDFNFDASVSLSTICLFVHHFSKDLQFLEFVSKSLWALWNFRLLLLQWNETTYVTIHCIHIPGSLHFFLWIVNIPIINQQISLYMYIRNYFCFY